MPTSSLQQDNLPNPVVSLQLRKFKKHVMVNYIMWDSFKMHWKKNSERGKIAIYGSPINCFKMVFWVFFFTFYKFLVLTINTRVGTVAQPVKQEDLNSIRRTYIKTKEKVREKNKSVLPFFIWV